MISSIICTNESDISKLVRNRYIFFAFISALSCLLSPPAASVITCDHDRAWRSSGTDSVEVWLGAGHLLLRLAHRNLGGCLLLNMANRLWKDLVVLWGHFEIASDWQSGADLPGQVLHETCDAVLQTSDVLLIASDWDDCRLAAWSCTSLNADRVGLDQSLNWSAVDIWVRSCYAGLWKIEGEDDWKECADLSSSRLDSCGFSSNRNLVGFFRSSGAVRIWKVNMAASFFHHFLDCASAWSWMIRKMLRLHFKTA